MEDVPAFAHLMRSFYAESLGQLAPAEILADVARHRALADAVLAPVAPRDGGLVIDVGTGAGLLALAAARRFTNARVLGVDVAVEAVDRARDAAREAGLANARFEEGFAEALPVADGAADAVVALAAFNLFPDKEGFVHEARRALAPGGVLVVADAFCVTHASEATNGTHGTEHLQHLSRTERTKATDEASALAVQDEIDDLPPTGPGPLTSSQWARLLSAAGMPPIASRDVTDVRRALDASRAWRYPPLVDGFAFRVEAARRRG